MKKKILIVDDNNDILDMFEIILYKEFEVITSVNGFEGLKKAVDETPDLIITDITMPVMDGIKFFNQIRKHSPLKNTPVIAVTNFANDYPGKSLLAMGFTATFPKPFTKDDIISTIKNLLKEDV